MKRCKNHPERLAYNKTFSLCQECNKERVNKNKAMRGIDELPITKKPNKILPRTEKNKKETADMLLLFKKIWDTRPRVSQVSGTPLGAFSVQLFSHILPRSTYRKFMLRDDNIWLVTPQEHYEWEFGDRKDPKWDKKKEQYEKLKQQYHANHPSKD